MTTAQKILAAIIAAVVIVGGAYLLTAHPAGAPGTATSTPQAATTTPSRAATSTPVGSASGSVAKPAGTTLVTPDFKKPIAFSASVSADIRAQLNKELATVSADLAKNPLHIQAWINLGTIRKQGGDYQGAREAWEYIADILPTNPVAFNNLGDLYANFLHDNAKAEANFLTAIKLQPKNVQAYADLYTMYHFTLHNDTKAAAILSQGLKANPGNNYLLGLQADLQAAK